MRCYLVNAHIHVTGQLVLVPGSRGGSDHLSLNLSRVFVLLYWTHNLKTLLGTVCSIDMHAQESDDEKLASASRKHPLNSFQMSHALVSLEEPAGISVGPLHLWAEACCFFFTPFGARRFACFSSWRAANRWKTC